MSHPTTPADAPDTDAAESPAAARPERRDHVTAVLVCHDGARWLPAVLTSLARSARQPHVAVAVDCGSTDATAELLAAALREGVIDQVVAAPRTTGFGAAVAAGVAAAEPPSAAWGPAQQWLWLLHDDSAPDPAALDELVHATDDQPSIGVVGPKVRGWHDRRLLLECGLTMSRGGARVTGLERGEQDQGQRDPQRDVLAVGSAGLLVRRDAWDAVGGLDPELVMFRDDLDLCWRVRRAGFRVVVTGAAVVHHREAAARGRRAGAGATAAVTGRHSPRRRDRASALHVLLAHAGRLALPFVLVRLVLASLLRALGYLLGKSPLEARDELGAVLDTLRRPRSLARSRALVRRAGRSPTAVPAREVRALLAPRAGQARALWERGVGFVVSGDPGSAGSSLDAQLDEDVSRWAVPGGPSRLRRLLTRPGVVLTLALLVITLVAVRQLLGTGELLGGALLAAPSGAGDLMAGYLAGWHDVGLGSALAAPPWLALLALPAAILRGQAPLAVDAVLLLAVPLAGAAAYLALGGLVRSPWIRCWAAASYALLPAITGAVGSGRLGTAVVAVLLPPLARSSARLVGVGRPPTWRRAWGTGLLLAVVVAFVPALWFVAAVLAALAGLLLGGGTAQRLRLLVAVAVPAALAGPWLLRLLRDPGLTLLEPGLTGPTDRGLDGLDLTLLHPGGPAGSPLWWTVPLVLAALAALLRRDVRRGVVAGWLVVLAALALGLVQLAARVSVDGAADPVRPWPGPATLVAGGAMLTVAAVAAGGLRARSAGWSFGWRQPVVVVLAAATLIAPIGAAVMWFSGVDGPLRREDPQVVPAFVAADIASPTRPRALLLRQRADHVEYELLNSEAPRLGDRDVSVAPDAEVAAAVGALVAGAGGDEADVLGSWAIKYVLLQGAATKDDRLRRTLDGQAGLRRVAGDAGSALWRVEQAVARARAVPAAPPGQEAPPPTVLPIPPGRGVSLQADVPPAARTGRVVLAQTADPGWTARAGGPDGPVQTFGRTGPPAAGRWWASPPDETATVFVSYEDPGRSSALWLQLAALAIVVLLALPGRRRPAPEDEDEDEARGDPARDAAAPDPPLPLPPEPVQVTS